MPRLRVGRHDIANVPAPPGGFGTLPQSALNTLATLSLVSVPDPYDPRRRIRAVARLDLLDRERRTHRIDEAAYRAGREVEAMFAAMARAGSGAGQWMEGDRVDAGTTAELAIVLGVERALKVNGFLGFLVGQLGRADARLLWEVLGLGHSFMTAASLFGRLGRRAHDYTADRFRDALAQLADARAARGRGSRSGGQPLRRGIASSRQHPAIEIVDPRAP